MNALTRGLAATAVATAALVSSPVVASAATTGTEAVVDCFTWTSGGRAYAACNIASGQARVRADCAWAPDLYSPWVGKGSWTIWSGKCPWGIRGAILETRN
ncbi:MAG: hypothetical protein ACOYBY_00545 [Dermatophilaceae bacterium]